MVRKWHSITFSDIHGWTTGGQNVSDLEDVVFRMLHFSLEWSDLTWKVLVRIQLFWNCSKLEMDLILSSEPPFLFETEPFQAENVSTALETSGKAGTTCSEVGTTTLSLKLDISSLHSMEFPLLSPPLPHTIITSSSSSSKSSKFLFFGKCSPLFSIHLKTLLK